LISSATPLSLLLWLMKIALMQKGLHGQRSTIAERQSYGRHWPAIQRGQSPGAAIASLSLTSSAVGILGGPLPWPSPFALVPCPLSAVRHVRATLAPIIIYHCKIIYHSNEIGR